jgi:hypothetical protein
MAAQLEEAVVDAHGLDPQQLLEDEGDAGLGVARRPGVGGAQGGAGVPSPGHGRGGPFAGRFVVLHSRTRRHAALASPTRADSGLDPVAGALEGIGGQAHASALLAGVEAGPVDRHASQPEAAEGFQQKGLVRLRVVLVAQRGQRQPFGFPVPCRGILERQGREPEAGPDLQEDARRVLPHGGEASGEADRLDEVAGPIRGVGGLGRGDPGAGDVRDVGDLRRRQAQAAGQAGQLGRGGLHPAGVEGMGGRQPAGWGSLRRQPRLQGGHGLLGAAGHADAGGVDRRQVQAVTEQGAQALLPERDRQHRPAGQPIEEPGALRHQPRGVLQGQDSGQAGRGVLAQAVAEQGVGADPPLHPELGQGVLHGEHGRLGVERTAQAAGGLVVAGGAPGAAEQPAQVGTGPRVLPFFQSGREDHLAQVDAEQGLEEHGGSIQGLPEGGLGGVQAAGHARVVVSHPGEQEGHRPVTRLPVAAQHPPRIAAGEQPPGLLGVAADHRPPVGEDPPSHLKGEGRIGQIDILQGPRQPVGGRFQGGLGLGGQHQELPGPRRAPRLGLGGFLEHHVGVGAAEAEGADPGTARPFRVPIGEPVGDVERAGLQVEGRVGPLEVEGRRDLPVLQGEHRLGQAGDARRHRQVADVGLDRAQGAEVAPAGTIAAAEGLGQGGHLDGVAKGGAGAVALHVGDRAGIDARQGLGGGDGLGLAVHARGGEADAGGAVVVHRRAEDDRADGVAVRQGVLQAAQHHHSDAAAVDRAVGAGVEGAAGAVRRVEPAGGVEVPGPLRQLDRDAARERHVAGVREEALAGQDGGDQRGRAGGLHVEARAAKVELVGDVRGEVVAVGAEGGLVAADRLQQPGVAREVVQEVAAEGHAAEDADQAGEALRVVPGVFEGLVGVLQEEPVLGVHQLGLARRDVEEGGVEPLDVVEHATGLHVVGIAERLGGGGGLDLVVREAGDGVETLAQVAPELLDVSGPRVSACETDNGDAVELVCVAHGAGCLTGGRR